MARPTEYKGELTIAASIEYLDSCVDTNKQLIKTENEDTGHVTYENKLEVKIPTVEGLSLHLNVSRETLYAWGKTYVEFSDILEILRAKQADRLLNKGLSGDYNPTIAKMMASKHGYIEHQQIALTTHDDEPTDEELAETIRRSTHGSENAGTEAAQ